MKKYQIIMPLLICISINVLNAQEIPLTDSSNVVILKSAPRINYQDKAYQFSAGKLILPSAFITYGALSLTSDALKTLNGSTRYEIDEHQPTHIKLDNYTQYMPVALVYGLNYLGVKGKHNFRDRTIIYATSQLISSAVVLPLKHMIKEERPDGSNNLSFPSGHTATAFSSAQFMFREYRDKNFWLSISGYPIAIFTGIYRTLNNKHWLGDVVAGAGIGMLSTEIAYWLFPITSQLLGGKRNIHSRLVLPNYNSGTPGLTFIQIF